MTDHSPTSDRGTALVTAAARRVGRQLALTLAELGFDIAVHCHTSISDAEKTAQEIRELGRKAKVFQCDLRDVERTKSLLKTVAAEMSPLTMLINNASVFRQIGMLKSTDADFDENFAVHVKAPYLLIREFGLHCRGHVVNIIDTNVVYNSTAYFPYMLSKKTLFELTKMSARELAPDIRVNAIAPGIILPPDLVDREKFERDSVKNPLHQKASPSDVCRALEYLVRSQHVTGECLFVDGGDHVAC